MLQWIIAPRGQAQCILDEHCFRDLQGQVSAWLFGNGVYSLTGEHIGWFEAGALRDLHQQLLGTATDALDTSLGLEMPVFQRRPRIPTLKARHPRRPLAAYREPAERALPSGGLLERRTAPRPAPLAQGA